MIFVTILTIEPSRNREVYDRIKKLPIPKEIKLIRALGTFGPYDAVLVYEAPSEGAAMNFVLTICEIEGVIDTETCLAVDIR